MPAYRSTAEAEVRDAVVARLRQLRPGARIMHEVNACGFGNRIDVLAVDRAEIIAVEVKSAKDKLDRLPDQIKAMRGCSHHVIAALHEKHLAWRQSRTIDGYKWLEGPPEAKGSNIWAFPEIGGDAKRGYGVARWEEPHPVPMQALPWGALNMLWAGELATMCSALGIASKPRADMPTRINALRWNATGAQITKAVCAALRARRCIEADPSIEVVA